METRPHPLVETFAGWLLPPACREHVLGDLYERNASTSQYVFDAIRTIPFAIWGQIRRTSSAALVASEAGAVYVAFLSALALLPNALVGRSAPLRAGIPALAALAVVVLRDAWVGRRPRPDARVAVDALLGIAGAAVSQALLAAVGSPLALPASVLWLGSAIGLALLSGVRIALSSANQMETANAVGNGMKSEPLNARGRELHDLLPLWWWTIAVVGLAGGIGLFFFPGMSRFHPFLIAWLVAFVAIGIYQHRRIHWPAPPPEGLTTPDRRRAYRAELEHRRDQQYRWPARRPAWIVAVIGLAVLMDLATLFLPSAQYARPVFPLMAQTVVAVLALSLYLFTRRLTNRAAQAFQREIDALDSSGPDQGN